MVEVIGEAGCHLADHVIHDKRDHPNGPGAKEWYALCDKVSPHAYRPILMKEMKRHWPRDVCEQWHIL